MKGKKIRLDEGELLRMIRDQHPSFPYPRRWDFKLTFYLSIAAIASAIIGTIISIVALLMTLYGPSLYSSSSLLVPVLSIIAVIVELTGLGWINKKMSLIEPGGEYYSLRAYYCPECESPYDKPFFSSLVATSMILNKVQILELPIPVTYIIQPQLHASLKATGVRTHLAKRSRRVSLSRRFTRWYFYRNYVTNSVFKDNKIRIAKIWQKLGAMNSVTISVFSFHDFELTGYGFSPNSKPSLVIEGGTLLLARSIYFGPDLQLDTIEFADGTTWPPSEISKLPFVLKNER